MLNRRLFFGATAAVAAMTAPAVTVANVGADAELLEMGRQWEVLFEQKEAAYAEAARLQDLFDASKPPPPRLRITQEDLNRGVGMRAARLGGVISPEEFRRILRNAKTYTPDVVPTRYKWSRRFIRADEAHITRVEARRRAIGLCALEDECDRLYDAIRALEDRIIAEPCSTLAGARVKARVAKTLIPGPDQVDNDWHDTAALSVINSILNGGLN